MKYNIENNQISFIIEKVKLWNIMNKKIFSKCKLKHVAKCKKKFVYLKR